MPLDHTHEPNAEQADSAGPLPYETWDPVDPPPREWVIPGKVPAGRLSAMYGTGAAGKTTIMIQIAAAVMDGGSPLRPLPGMTGADDLRASSPMLQPLGTTGSVLWLSWEDERDEFIRRWRMAYRAGAISVPFPDPERLSLVDMRKIGGPLWRPEGSGNIANVATWTEAGLRFLRSLEDHRLAIIDPLAAAYASSEIDRPLVRAFTSTIDGAGENEGCAVLMIAHPSEGGAAKGGKGYSGSTDWQASVRAFLSLQTSDETAHQIEADKPMKATAYCLKNQKQSYAPDGDTLWLVRHYREADGSRPAELAWFGARAGDAAKRYEENRAKGQGRRVRSIVPDVAKASAASDKGFTRPPPE